MKNHTVETSPQVLARIAGLLYLAIIRRPSTHGY